MNNKTKNLLFSVSCVAAMAVLSLPFTSKQTGPVLNETKINRLAKSDDDEQTKANRLLVVLSHEETMKPNWEDNLGSSLVGAFNIRNLSDACEVALKRPKANKNLFLNYKRILEITFSDEAACADSLQKLKENEGVESAEMPFMEICFDSTTPSDTDFSDQWGLTKIGAPTAWDYTTGSSSIKVAVIDSGMKSDHEDLSSNAQPGYDFHANSSDSSDSFGHGTHVSGIIGAKGNNSKGVAGVCWDVGLVPLKCSYWGGWFNAKCYADSAAIISALNYAQGNGIRFANMSFGSSTAENNAVKTAMQNFSGLIAVSAGNTGSDISINPTYPASWHLPNTIVVGASDENDNLWSDGTDSSNYSSALVDIFAPGSNILSTSKNGSYVRANGTSMAAPFVIGSAALLASYYTTLNLNSIRETIIWNRTYNPTFYGKCVAAGRLNLANAMQNPLHAHSYDHHFVYANGSQHYSYCDCGAYVMEGHVHDMANTWWQGGVQYGNCVFCEHSFPL
ncbi:MAG: S8 family serine peptidase [Bacilli bacterium]|nr:S8 family serine peptidase [Bacilli bacterium]